MIVNKSMFPLQTGFGVLSKMQDKFSTLQMQLGTGMKAQTLSEMGRDLPVSLSVRARLSSIAGFSANIEQVALRLSFYDNALTRMDKLEGEGRTSAVQGQYGTNNISMSTLPTLSKARLDEMVTMLNADVAGRYLFGGSKTDKPPVANTAELMDGVGGRAGYKTVLNERRMADAGELGLGRLTATVATVLDTASVTLAEDGAHPFGFKLSTVSTVGDKITVDKTDLAAAQGSIKFDFKAAPDGVQPGQTVTLGFTMPDGTETQLTLRAVEKATGAAGEFVIKGNAADTAEEFQKALTASLTDLAQSELSAASAFAAAENFFNGAGEPILRVDGNDPYSATALRLGTPLDTVSWYSGESPAVSAQGMGRLTGDISGDSVTLSENAPWSKDHGFKLASATSNSTANPSTAATVGLTGSPATMSVKFDAVPTAGDKVSLTLREPGGKERVVTLTAVTGRAGPGQFTIGSGADDAAKQEATAANFQAALTRSVTEAAADAQGNPRQSVGTAIEDGGRVNYGMQANETGYLRMMRSFAAASAETYPELTATSDPNSASLKPAKARFDAMAKRQQGQLSEGRNNEPGSIEIITMELGIARGALNAASTRHTNYKAQLSDLLSDVETVSKEDVAMEILALQTRLTASYQVTAMVSQLSLVNFLR